MFDICSIFIKLKVTYLLDCAIKWLKSHVRAGSKRGIQMLKVGKENLAQT